MYRCIYRESEREREREKEKEKERKRERERARESERERGYRQRLVERSVPLLVEGVGCGV